MKKIKQLFKKVSQIFKLIKQYSIYSTVVILLLFLFMSRCDRSMNADEELIKVEIAKKGTLYSSKVLAKSSTTKYYSEEIGEVQPGQNAIIMESDSWSGVKIRLMDGTTGWMKTELLKPSNKTFIKHNAPSPNRHISEKKSIGKRNIVKEVNDKTEVIRLEEVEEERGPGNIIQWTKVKTKDGTTGWIMSDYLYQFPIEPYRWIDRKEWYYNKKRFIKKWTGETINDFSDKYAEASGIKKTPEVDTYFFNNITLRDNSRKKKYEGIKVEVKDGIIQNIITPRKKMYWASFLPLSTFLHVDFLSNQIGNYMHFFEDKEEPLKEATAISSTFLRIVVAILALSIIILALYSILKFPYFFINKIALKRSYNTNLSNRKINMTVLLFTILIGYPYVVILLTNIHPFSTYFWISILFCFGMMIGFIRRWKRDLAYNRCNAKGCRLWTGSDNGTEYLGQTTTTQNIRYSDGSSETNKQTVRRYRDHRICTNCGNQWYIDRRETWGKLK